MRHLAMGDCLSAGYGAVPATQGFSYLLFTGGVFNRAPVTPFANAADPGVSSRQVMKCPVSQATDAFRPHVITLVVGGKDLLRIPGDPDPYTVLAELEMNACVIRVIMEKKKP